MRVKEDILFALLAIVMTTFGTLCLIYIEFTVLLLLLTIFHAIFIVYHICKIIKYYRNINS